MPDPSSAVSSASRLPLDGDDVFLASWPRSGNTWFRCIVAHLLFPDAPPAKLSDLNTLVPDIHVHVPAKQDGQCRVIKTHEPWGERHGMFDAKLYRRFIYIVRHPCDAIESWYDRLVHGAGGCGWMDGTTLHDFMRQCIHGACRYGAWADHVRSWQFAAERRAALWIRYEDALAEPRAAIAQVARFLGAPADADTITWVAAQTDIESMNRLNANGPLLDPGYEFIRGDAWQRQTKARLSASDRAAVWQAWGSVMTAWGYDVSGAVALERPGGARDAPS